MNKFSYAKLMKYDVIATIFAENIAFNIYIRYVQCVC